MSVDHSKLVPGQQISDQTYLLDSELVSKYTDAVGDQSQLHTRDDGAGTGSADGGRCSQSPWRR